MWHCGSNTTPRRHVKFLSFLPAEKKIVCNVIEIVFDSIIFSNKLTTTPILNGES